ncbi:hypothetical protein G7054_g6659 [Neopestalotiopsis clavispora]|nr:hypothetical protein G7054_g6659 [Neopestalotiopsis clavispora]
MNAPEISSLAATSTEAKSHIGLDYKGIYHAIKIALDLWSLRETKRINHEVSKNFNEIAESIAEAVYWSMRKEISSIEAQNPKQWASILKATAIPKEVATIVKTLIDEKDYTQGLWTLQDLGIDIDLPRYRSSAHKELDKFLYRSIKSHDVKMRKEKLDEGRKYLEHGKYADLLRYYESCVHNGEAYDLKHLSSTGKGQDKMFIISRLITCSSKSLESKSLKRKRGEPHENNDTNLEILTSLAAGPIVPTLEPKEIQVYHQHIIGSVHRRDVQYTLIMALNELQKGLYEHWLIIFLGLILDIYPDKANLKQEMPLLWYNMKLLLCDLWEFKRISGNFLTLEAFCSFPGQSTTQAKLLSMQLWRVIFGGHRIDELPVIGAHSKHPANNEEQPEADLLTAGFFNVYRGSNGVQKIRQEMLELNPAVLVEEKRWLENIVGAGMGNLDPSDGNLDPSDDPSDDQDDIDRCTKMPRLEANSPIVHGIDRRGEQAEPDHTNSVQNIEVAPSPAFSAFTGKETQTEECLSTPESSSNETGIPDNTFHSMPPVTQEKMVETKHIKYMITRCIQAIGLRVNESEPSRLADRLSEGSPISAEKGHFREEESLLETLRLDIQSSLMQKGRLEIELREARTTTAITKQYQSVLINIKEKLDVHLPERHVDHKEAHGDFATHEAILDDVIWTAQSICELIMEQKKEHEQSKKDLEKLALDFTTMSNKHAEYLAIETKKDQQIQELLSVMEEHDAERIQLRNELNSVDKENEIFLRTRDIKMELEKTQSELEKTRSELEASKEFATRTSNDAAQVRRELEMSMKATADKAQEFQLLKSTIAIQDYKVQGLEGQLNSTKEENERLKQQIRNIEEKSKKTESQIHRISNEMEYYRVWLQEVHDALTIPGQTVFSDVIGNWKRGFLGDIIKKEISDSAKTHLNAFKEAQRLLLRLFTNDWNKPLPSVRKKVLDVQSLLKIGGLFHKDIRNILHVLVHPDKVPTEHKHKKEFKDAATELFQQVDEWFQGINSEDKHSDTSEMLGLFKNILNLRNQLNESKVAETKGVDIINDLTAKLSSASLFCEHLNGCLRAISTAEQNSQLVSLAENLKPKSDRSGVRIDIDDLRQKADHVVAQIVKLLERDQKLFASALDVQPWGNILRKHRNRCLSEADHDGIATEMALEIENTAKSEARKKEQAELWIVETLSCLVKNQPLRESDDFSLSTIQNNLSEANLFYSDTFTIFSALFENDQASSSMPTAVKGRLQELQQLLLAQRKVEEDSLEEKRIQAYERLIRPIRQDFTISNIRSQDRRKSDEETRLELLKISEADWVDTAVLVNKAKNIIEGGGDMQLIVRIIDIMRDVTEREKLLSQERVSSESTRMLAMEHQHSREMGEAQDEINELKNIITTEIMGRKTLEQNFESCLKSLATVLYCGQGVPYETASESQQKLMEEVYKIAEGKYKELSLAQGQVQTLATSLTERRIAEPRAVEAESSSVYQFSDDEDDYSKVIRRLEEEVSAVQYTCDEYQRKLEQAESALEATRQQLTATTSELSSTRADFTQAQSQIRVLTKSVKDMESMLGGDLDSIEKIKSEKEVLNKQCRELEEKLRSASMIQTRHETELRSKQYEVDKWKTIYEEAKNSQRDLGNFFLKLCTPAAVGVETEQGLREKAHERVISESQGDNRRRGFTGSCTSAPPPLPSCRHKCSITESGADLRKTILTILESHGCSGCPGILEDLTTVVSTDFSPVPSNATCKGLTKKHEKCRKIRGGQSRVKVLHASDDETRNRLFSSFLVHGNAADTAVYSQADNSQNQPSATVAPCLNYGPALPPPRAEAALVLRFHKSVSELGRGQPDYEADCGRLCVWYVLQRELKLRHHRLENGVRLCGILIRILRSFWGAGAVVLDAAVLFVERWLGVSREDIDELSRRPALGAEVFALERGNEFVQRSCQFCYHVLLYFEVSFYLSQLLIFLPMTSWIAARNTPPVVQYTTPPLYCADFLPSVVTEVNSLVMQESSAPIIFDAPQKSGNIITCRMQRSESVKTDQDDACTLDYPAQLFMTTLAHRISDVILFKAKDIDDAAKTLLTWMRNAEGSKGCRPRAYVTSFAKCDQCPQELAQKDNPGAHLSVHDTTKRFHCLMDDCTKPQTYACLESLKDKKDKKPFAHFKEIYKNMNRGIKGRCVGRTIQQK